MSKHMGSFHRLARLLALLAILLNQPLTAIHAATDEKHLFHGHAAHLAHASHEMRTRTTMVIRIPTATII